MVQVRWWLRGENIYVAHNIDVGKAIRYVLDGLKQQVMYEIRVFGYSRGGDGLQSSPVLEFVLGEVLFCFVCIWWHSIVVRPPVLPACFPYLCARLTAGRVTTLWVKRPLSVSQQGRLSLPSLRGRLNE